MTPEEAASRFGKLNQMIARDLPAFIQERVAQNAVEMIRQRVTLQGRNCMGGNFSPYSTRPILSTGITEKSKRVWRALASSKKKREALQWVTVKHKGKDVLMFVVEGGYAEIRRLEGLQTAHKDFWFTSQMWRGFGVKRVSKGKNEITITLGGRNAEAQKKIDENSKREGISIICLSDSELKSLAKMVDNELKRYINKVGLL